MINLRRKPSNRHVDVIKFIFVSDKERTTFYIDLNNPITNIQDETKKYKVFWFDNITKNKHFSSFTYTINNINEYFNQKVWIKI